MNGMSVNDICSIVKVSAPTVRARIKELEIEPHFKKGKALMYGFGDCEIIFKSFGVSADEITERATANEKEKKTKEKEKKKENGGYSKYAGLSGAELVDFLFDELERKEKEKDFLEEQINKKDELIKSLNNKNDFLMAQQMGLSLEDFRARAGADSDIVESKEEKKSFFKRFFRKD